MTIVNVEFLDAVGEGCGPQIESGRSAEVAVDSSFGLVECPQNDVAFQLFQVSKSHVLRRGALRLFITGGRGLVP